MNHDILSRLERLLGRLKKGEEMLYKDMIKNFDPKDELLVEIALTELVERGVIVVEMPGDEKTLSQAKIVKLTPREVVKERSVIQEAFYEVVLTTPETVRELLEKFVSTKTCFRRLFSDSKRELLVLEPFIDSVMVETFEEELREMAKRGIQIQIITREVGKDTSNLKAILRLYELYALNAPKKDLLEIYEYWFPIKYGDDVFRHFIGLHAKMLIQNGKNAYIGSTNWTQESLSRNFEVGILTNDAILIKSLRKIFRTLMLESQKLDLTKLYERSISKVGKE